MKKIKNETNFVEKEKKETIKQVIKERLSHYSKQEIKDFFSEILKEFQIEVLSHESLYHHVVDYEKPNEKPPKQKFSVEFKKCAALLKKELKKLKKLLESNKYIIHHSKVDEIYSIRIYDDSVFEFDCENDEDEDFQIDLTEEEQEELQSLKNAQEFIDDFKIYKLIDNKKGK
ncbi:hypothetical protein M0P65_05875 [Candidatus Gracilibacteria bacterium]|jgi:hypothetical protein|nr:hypothetical protein [Candidatus Gracilibacteria bacterium]